MKSKQLIFNIVATLLAFVVNTGISFFLTPYITSSIGEEAYGFIALANNFVMYASLVTIALNSMAGRFITIKIHQGKLEEANKYFTSILIANIFFTVILILPSALVVYFLDDFLTISKELIFDVKLLFALIFINFFLSIINATYSTATFVKNRLDLSSKVNIVSYLLRAGLLFVLFAILVPRVSYMGIASCVVSIYVLIMNIYYTKKLLPNISVKKKYFDIKKIIQIIKSGIWNTITKLGQILTDGLDLLVTNIFISPKAMGQFAIVKTITTCLNSFVSTFAGVFSPQQTIDYAKGDLDVVVDDIKFSMKLTSFISNIPYVFLVVFGFYFYKLWVPDVDTNILNILSILSVLSQLTLSSIVPLWQIFTITNKLKVNSLVTVGTGLLNILIVFILVNTTDLGVIAIAGVSSITGVIKNITYTPIYSAHCLGVSKKTFYPEIFKNLFVTTLLILINLVVYSIFPIDTWAKLFIAIVICGIIGVVLNYLLLFSKEEKRAFLGIIKKFVKKFSGLEKLIWNIRVRLRNIYWLYYEFKKIDNNKIILDNFNGNGYGESPKYIAESLIKRNPNYDLVWVLNEKNIHKSDIVPSYVRTVLYGSKEWIYEQCTAKVWIDNVRKTYFFRKRKNQIYIQAWHGGIGVKQVEKDVQSMLAKKYIKYAKRDSSKADLFISDSSWETDLYRRSFWYNGEIIECGLPRNDVLFDKEAKKQIIKKLDKCFGLDKKTIKILYAPTFRKNLGLDIYKLEFDKIVKAVEKSYGSKAVILIKLHPNVIHLANELEYNANVINANAIMDTQELEIYSDILITDYSGIMFDFLLMKKPCFVHANDFDNYMKERHLYFDLSKLPFPLSKNDNELVTNISKFDEQKYLKKINEFSSNHRMVVTGSASDDIADWIENKMGGNKNHDS